MQIHIHVKNSNKTVKIVETYYIKTIQQKQKHAKQLTKDTHTNTQKNSTQYAKIVRTRRPQKRNKEHNNTKSQIAHTLK